MKIKKKISYIAEINLDSKSAYKHQVLKMCDAFSQQDFEVTLYVINSNNVWEQDGIVFIDNTVLDDLNQKGNTLGKRRLQTPLKNLFNLKFQCYILEKCTNLHFYLNLKIHY